MSFDKEIIDQIIENVIKAVADPELSETINVPAYLVTSREFDKIADCIGMAIGSDLVVGVDKPDMCGYWTIDVFKDTGNDYELLTSAIFDMVDE